VIHNCFVCLSQRLEYEDMLKYEKQFAKEKAQQQQQSMSRTDTFVLNSSSNGNAHNQSPDSPLRSTSVQPTRALVRASSESNIAVHRQVSDTSAQLSTHAVDDAPPRRAPHRERRSGRLDAEMLDFVRSAAVRTSEGMIMISVDLFEKLLGRCEDLLASHAELEVWCVRIIVNGAAGPMIGLPLSNSNSARSGNASNRDSRREETTASTRTTMRVLGTTKVSSIL
jgi:hypothetical protein